MDCIIQGMSRVILVGKEEYPEQMTSFSPSLKYHELIFHFSGTKTVHFNGVTLEDGPNCIRFLPQGPVFEYTVERHEPGPCIDIFFTTDIPVSEVPFVVHMGDNSKFAALFQNIFSVWVAKGEGYRFTCMSLLYNILAQLNRHTYISGRQYEQIKPVADYINENFLHKNISAKELESLCPISYPYMKKLFVARYGVPPKKYMIQLRLNHACDLLRSERYSVTEVAELCGFRDVSFFSRQFKDRLGISPAEFMKKYHSSK